MKPNIALSGFMGTGKTAVGRILAKKLNLEFVETDTIIEEKTGQSIPQIFTASGETGFRELEIEVTKEIAKKQHTVIACGGGLVLNRINIDRLRQDAVIVNLTASPTVTLKRITNQVGQRPLLDVTDPLSTIRDMIKFRKPFYEHASDMNINTSRLTPEAVAEEIIRRIKENESLHR
jgi:shikimate kinase